jgi:hypothetical protein
MTGIMKKPMIRASRKYRMNRPLMEATTMGATFLFKELSALDHGKNLFPFIAIGLSANPLRIEYCFSRISSRKFFHGLFREALSLPPSRLGGEFGD